VTGQRLCRRSGDPIFESADVGFVRQIQTDPGGEVGALLWEAEPDRFAARYPDSRIIESYGQEYWPPGCIDYWVYVEAKSRQVRLSVEGWHGPDQILDVTGDGIHDGLAIGEAFAHILRVPSPHR
jgi:hypothetical protein